MLRQAAEGLAREGREDENGARGVGGGGRSLRRRTRRVGRGRRPGGALRARRRRMRARGAHWAGGRCATAAGSVGRGARRPTLKGGNDPRRGLVERDWQELQRRPQLLGSMRRPNQPAGNQPEHQASTQREEQTLVSQRLIERYAGQNAQRASSLFPQALQQGQGGDRRRCNRGVSGIARCVGARGGPGRRFSPRGGGLWLGFGDGSR